MARPAPLTAQIEARCARLLTQLRGLTRAKALLDEELRRLRSGEDERLVLARLTIHLPHEAKRLRR